MIGPGKYDDVCTKARAMAKAHGALLVIFKGEKGHGFACQMTEEGMQGLAKVLRDVADQVERDMKELKEREWN